jgi:N6-L-threonylcarbamoyladenine synthase
VIVLGIETSCDETACGIVEIDERQNCTLLANVVFSSMDLHKVYGGVVPEIAARSHIESIIPVIEQALAEAFTHYPLPITHELAINDEQLSSNGKMLNDNSMKKAKGKKENTLNPWDLIDAISVTYGAGLGGSLLVGVMTARTLAIAKNKPLYAINHVEAHVYANFLTETRGSKVESRKSKEAEPARSTLDVRRSTNTWQLGEQTYVLPASAPQFPLLALIVSGGHTQLVLFRDHFDYTLLGRTRDDAIGEAFDKVAKIIGLPYPGGPSVAKAALSGDATKYSLPKSRLEGESEGLASLRLNSPATNPQPPAPTKNYDFSFSGLKTAVLRLAQQEIGEDFTFPSFDIASRLSERQKADIAASFQRVAIETVVDKAILAVEEFQPKSVVIAGGVAASQELRKQLEVALRKITDELSINDEQLSSNGKMLNDNPTKKAKGKMANHFISTDIKLCTDNGAMIATLGAFKALHNQPTADPHSLNIQPNLSM